MIRDMQRGAGVGRDCASVDRDGPSVAWREHGLSDSRRHGNNGDGSKARPTRTYSCTTDASRRWVANVTANAAKVIDADGQVRLPRNDRRKHRHRSAGDRRRADDVDAK